MDISKRPIRIVTALLLASFILVYTVVESSNHYDFTQRCKCGSQAVYYSEKTPYVVQQLIPAALVSAVVVLAAIGHPLLGVITLAILFSLIGSAQIQNNIFHQSYAGQPRSPHYEYMQSLGSLKIRFGIMWGLIGIFSGIGLYVTRNWEI